MFEMTEETILAESKNVVAEEETTLDEFFSTDFLNSDKSMKSKPDKIQLKIICDNPRIFGRKARKDYYREFRKSLRYATLCKISNSDPPVCVNCGCNELMILEINHKNGGGCQEYKLGMRSKQLCRAIYRGDRNIDEFDIRCRVCNNLHYAEIKCGYKLPFKITYG